MAEPSRRRKATTEKYWIGHYAKMLSQTKALFPSEGPSFCFPYQL